MRNMKLREYLTKNKIKNIINALDDKIEKNVFNITQGLFIDRLYRSFLLDDEIINQDNIDGVIKSHLCELIKEVRQIVLKKEEDLSIYEILNGGWNKLLNEEFNNLNSKKLNGILDSIINELYFCINI